MKRTTQNLTLSGVCLALCLVLPFLTGQLQELGNALCLMHIPVILCGFVCGWQYGMVVGLAAPVLRFLLFQMPPLFPIGISMSFELATYGLVTGILYQRLPKKNRNLYPVLVSAMLCGRVVWGIVRLLLAGISHTAFTWNAFLSEAFLTAIPGIVCHILLIPPVVMALKRAGYMEGKEEP